MSDDNRTPNPRVLVIDDMEEIHKAFRNLLCPRARASDRARLESSLFGSPAEAVRARGFEVDTAFQGEEALAMVRTALADGRPYAVAFCDMRMPPGWDGLQTIEAIWKVDPDLEVVICTAYSDYSDAEIAKRLGPSDQVLFLRKPFDANEVRQLARALTEKWGLRQGARVRTADLERAVATRLRELTSTNVLLMQEAERRQASDLELARVRTTQTLDQMIGAQAREVARSLEDFLGTTDDAPPAATRRAAKDLLALLAHAERASAAADDAFDLDQAITDVVALMRSVGIDTEVELVLEPLPLIHGPAPEVKLALMGLLDNALRAVATVPKGRVTISTRVEDDMVVMEMFDTGNAVSDTTRARIFQPWFIPQAGERSGMAFASRIVAERAGGNLTIDNAKDGGVSVFVKLPVQPAS